MPATKKSKTSKRAQASGSRVTVASISPCDRGPEIKNFQLSIRQTDTLTLLFQVCAGVGQLACHIGSVTTSEQRLIAEANAVDDNGVTIPVPLPSLQPGRYVLTWTFRVDGDDDWTTAHELSKPQATLFRLYKRRSGSRPANTMFMILDVTS